MAAAPCDCLSDLLSPICSKMHELPQSLAWKQGMRPQWACGPHDLGALCWENGTSQSSRDWPPPDLGPGLWQGLQWWSLLAFVGTWVARCQEIAPKPPPSLSLWNSAGQRSHQCLPVPPLPAVSMDTQSGEVEGACRCRKQGGFGAPPAPAFLPWRILSVSTSLSYFLILCPLTRCLFLTSKKIHPGQHSSSSWF